MKKILLCMVVGIVFCLSGQSVPPKGNPPPANHPSNSGKTPPKGKPNGSGQNKSKSKSKTSGQQRQTVVQGRVYANGRHGGRLSSHEERLIDAIGDADSLEQLMPLAQRARMSPSTDVRMAAVEALETRGRDCVNALADFMDDPSLEVADAAFTAWSNILTEMKPNRRLMAVQEAAKILQNGAPYRGHGHSGTGVPAMPVHY